VVVDGEAGAVLCSVETGLAASSVFAALTPDARARLAAAGRLALLRPGEVLFARGDVADALFVVLEGKVEARTRFVDGSEIRVAVAAVGELIGEMAALDGLERSAEVAAVQRSRLWRIPRGAMIDILIAEPEAAVALVIELARRLRNTNQALYAATHLDLGGRLARLLTMEAGKGTLVAITQTELARRLTASREKVNRKLHAFASEGLVALSRSGVHLRDREGLERLWRDGTV